MGLADLGDTQLKEFGVEVLTQARPLPASPGQQRILPAGTSAQVF